LADYEFPTDCHYTAEDEWVRQEGDVLRVGITDYAQKQLGDIVFVELPTIGAAIEKGKPFAVIESVKAVSDLFAPVSGTVVEINQALEEAPEQVNEKCYSDGWILTVRPTSESAIADLMDSDSYRQHVAGRKE
jgi:glycine cleavage system H protein